MPAHALYDKITELETTLVHKDQHGGITATIGPLFEVFADPWLLERLDTTDDPVLDVLVMEQVARFTGVEAVVAFDQRRADALGVVLGRAMVEHLLVVYVCFERRGGALVCAVDTRTEELDVFTLTFGLATGVAVA